MLYVSVENTESELKTIKTDEFPQVGDTVVIQKLGVYIVKERGIVANTNHDSKKAARFIIVEEKEGSVAPPSGRYNFAENFQ